MEQNTAPPFEDRSDLRFAAELLNHAVFAEPERGGARELLADVYERLGFGAENGTWCNFYLTGAQELRRGPGAGGAPVSAAGMAAAHWPDPAPGDADLTLTLSRPQLLGLLAGKGMGDIQTSGDPAMLQRLLGLLDAPDPDFAIVTP